MDTLIERRRELAHAVAWLVATLTPEERIELFWLVRSRLWWRADRPDRDWRLLDDDG